MQQKQLRDSVEGTPENTTQEVAGSNPAFSLQSVNIKPCSMGVVREFIETFHYSHSVKGITPFLCFEVVLKKDYSEQVGAAIFGWPGQVQTEHRYGEYSEKSKKCRYMAVELRRFVLKDELGRNAESQILGKIFQRLKILGVDRVFSYADPNQDRREHLDGKHTGMIYRATGFHRHKDAGRTSAIIILEDFETYKKGKRLPIRNLDQYRNYRVPASKIPPPAGKVLPPKTAFDFEDAKRRGEMEGKENRYAIVRQDRTSGEWVFVIKTEKYLTDLSKRIIRALKSGKAEMQKEKGKIVYLKDLQQGMQYFEPPKYEETYESRYAYRNRTETGEETGMA